MAMYITVYSNAKPDQRKLRDVPVLISVQGSILQNREYEKQHSASK